ncbi:hypothetical protein [Aurantiacibacter sp. MUD61]|uniref:hypothetical protein n=1 Tax=Aurantiacibacter sp. MUD61 TaxID=3009083 RepID=UPI0022F1421B|nr:hypothetical protein [Aurantiacibacter sp. MUD61]
MADLKRQLEEDLALRDLAKHLVKRDVENIKGDVEQKGLASRFADRMKEGAEGALDESTDFVKSNPGRVGSVAGLGIILLIAWLFREPLSEFFDELLKKLHLDELAPGSSKTRGEELAEALDDHASALADKLNIGENL